MTERRSMRVSAHCLKKAKEESGGEGGKEEDKRQARIRHRLVFKSQTALPWQQAGTGYPQKILGSRVQSSFTV